jgi:hypothetical protein
MTRLPFESSLYKALLKIRQRPSSRLVPATEGMSSFGNSENNGKSNCELKFIDSGKTLRKRKRGGISALTKKRKKQHRYHHYRKQYLLRRDTREGKEKNNNNLKHSPRIWKVADDVLVNYSWEETVIGSVSNVHNKDADDDDDDDCDDDDDENGGGGGNNGDSRGEASPRCEAGQDRAARSVASPRLLPQPQSRPHSQHPHSQHETTVVDTRQACAEYSTTSHEQQDHQAAPSNGGKESPAGSHSFGCGELVWVIQGKTDHLATCVGVGVGSETILVQWATNKLKQHVPRSSVRAFEMDDGKRRRTRRRKTKTFKNHVF